MMSGNILIIDIDDVLLDWTRSFDAYIRINYGYHGIELWNNPDRLWDVLCTTKKNTINIMQKHNQSEAFKYLDYYRDAKKICEVESYFTKIYSITACGVENSEARQWNIEQLFSNLIDEFLILPYFGQKNKAINSLIAKHHNDNIIFLDDNIHDVEYAHQLGVDAYLYYNVFYDNTKNLPMVKSMGEFVSIVKDKYRKDNFE